MGNAAPALKHRQAAQSVGRARLHAAAKFRTREPTQPGATLAEPADVPPPADPRRSRIGEVIVELRIFPRARAVQTAVRAGAVLLIAPLRGGAEIPDDDGALVIDPGSAALLVKPGVSTVAWREGSLCVVLHVPRSRLQAAASQRFGQPQRAAGGPVRLARDDGPEGFGADLDDLLRRAREATGPAGASAQDRFIDRLVAAIERQQLAPAVFLLARSVKRAMDQVRESGGQCDGDALAAAAGVTSRTLRNSFRACLGLTLATFIQQEQLETVRRQLASARESRTIQAIAEAAGFASAIAFSRAYQRCFGETPTQTRVRAVREAGSS